MGLAGSELRDPSIHPIHPIRSITFFFPPREKPREPKDGEAVVRFLRSLGHRSHGMVAILP